MNFVKTEKTITLSVGQFIETISREDYRFENLLKLLQANESNEKIIWCLYGDVIAKAKEALLKIGKRTI